MNILSIPLARIILAFISLVFIIQRFIRYIKKEKAQTFFKLTSTTVIWGSVFLISLYPQFAYLISKKLGFGDNLNTLIFLGFILVFFLIFRLLRTIEKLEKDITEIVRKDALKSLKK